MTFPQIPCFAAVRPVILITGFLGAGKTTLLRELLVATHGQDLDSDVILNDYADASIDLLTLEEFTKNIEPLTATCACCEGLDFLLELSMKSAKSESDLLFIELNGTADPVPIVETFTLLQEKLQLHPRWQVCVIDVRNFGKRGAYKDIEDLQLQTASHLYFTHECEEFSQQSIIEGIRKVNPFASIVTKRELIEQVFSLAKSSKPRLLDGERNQDNVDIRKVIKPANHYKAHEFTACKILLPEAVSEKQVREWLANLPPEVIRAKVLIGITEKPKYRYLFERVNLEVSKYIQKVTLDKNKVPNSAILIGPDIDPQNLEKVFTLKKHR
jgi:G3E family GTPase